MQAGHHEVEAEEDELVRNSVALMRVIHARQQPIMELVAVLEIFDPRKIAAQINVITR